MAPEAKLRAAIGSEGADPGREPPVTGPDACWPAAAADVPGLGSRRGERLYSGALFMLLRARRAVCFHGITLCPTLPMPGTRRGLEARTLKVHRVEVDILRTTLTPSNLTCKRTMAPQHLAFCALACAPLLAMAGRPLATDDAAVAEAGTCYIEAWAEKSGPDRAWVAAPACGVAPGWELGGDYTRPRPADPLRAEAGLLVKWVPEAWSFKTAWGELGLGLKASAGWQQPGGPGASSSWQASGSALLGLASLKINDSLTLHANLGVQRDRPSRTSASALNLAATWQPNDAWLLFAETSLNNKREIFGATVNTVGARWWLTKDTLGLDLTASRESVSGAKTGWTLGLGWYGIGL